MAEIPGCVSQTRGLGGRADSTAHRPKTDHLSLLHSPYKSSTFPLFSAAAHRLIKLTFPCYFWQDASETLPESRSVGGRWMDMWTERRHVLLTLDRLDHRTAFLTRMTVCITGFSFQLNKCCWRMTYFKDVCTSQHASLLVWRSEAGLCSSHSLSGSPLRCSGLCYFVVKHN